MTSPRRPHAIHNMRARMNRVSAMAAFASAQAEEAVALIRQSLEMGGEFFSQEKALELAANAARDLNAIAVECAVPVFEPGHTQQRQAKAQRQPQSQPARGLL